MKTMTKMQMPASIVASLVVVLGSGGSAGAQTRGAGPSIPGTTSEPLTTNVKYGDLNLDTTQGVKTLYGRLQIAARKVCEPFESQRIRVQMMWWNCYDRAMDSAVAQVNKESVTELYRHSYDRSPGR